MTLAEFLQTVSQAADAIKALAIAIFSNVIGWWLLISGGIRLAKWGQPNRQYGVSSIIARTAIGSCFIQGSQYLNTVVMTVTGSGMPASNAMSVMPSSSGGEPVAMVFTAALGWLAALGVVAILNGTRLIVKATDGHGNQSAQEDPIWTGCIYIFAGAIGVNLWRFIGGLI